MLNRYDDRIEEYTEISKESIEKVISAVSKSAENPSSREWSVIEMIADKLLEPYFYWAEDRQSGKGIETGPSVKTMDSLVSKYDLDSSGIGEFPSRIRLKRFIDRGFDVLCSDMKLFGYSYDRETRSFVRDSHQGQNPV